MITMFAPTGIGEITAGTDLATTIVSAAAREDQGPLREGDIVVVTSKILSKAEDRRSARDARDAAIDAETLQTVARRNRLRIVRTHRGLTIAAAGVDNSNVEAGSVLRLPVDPDASAARLRAGLLRESGVQVGVIVSDTAGRAWRRGQTDHAIGASGVRVLTSYAGQRDPYGNDLLVTAMAVADELAAAADLVKGKLLGCPVAVIRGLAHLVIASDVAETEASRADHLVRPVAEDLFRFGSREAVIAAVLASIGQPERYEEAVALTEGELGDLVRHATPGAAGDALVAVLAAAHHFGLPARPDVEAESESDILGSGP